MCTFGRSLSRLTRDFAPRQRGHNKYQPIAMIPFRAAAKNSSTVWSGGTDHSVASAIGRMLRSATIGACRTKSMRFGARPCEAGSLANSAASVLSRWRAAGSTESSTLVPGTWAQPSLSQTSRSIAAMDLPNSTSMIPACLATNTHEDQAVSAIPVKSNRQPSPSASSSQPHSQCRIGTFRYSRTWKRRRFSSIRQNLPPSSPERDRPCHGRTGDSALRVNHSSNRKGAKPVSS